METLTKTKKSVNPLVYAGLAEDIQLLAKYRVTERAENINLLLASVSVAFGASKAEILGTSRKAYIVDARTAFANLLRNLKNMTYHQIGAIFNKDHSTIIHYIDKHKDMIQFDAKYQSKMNVLNNILCRL